MKVTIPITQLRTNIATLLKRLQKDPHLVYRITHHKEVVAELKAPDKASEHESQASTEQEIAAFIDVYRKRGVPKRKGAYRRIRRLCATPSDALPYESLEKAMDTLRRRGHGPD
ncbi:MAG: type II toxin-antitoxin system Phd/YefM family antitoxin [Candidatus Latescibacteria bacterium]|nr:type II toxin-antitoxin system Phd/YefM family antitoxin [Candidatus Latescibacterota bacterium]